MEELELEIAIAIEDYNQTGDVSYLIKANHLTHQLYAEDRWIVEQLCGRQVTKQEMEIRENYIRLRKE